MGMKLRSRGIGKRMIFYNPSAGIRAFVHKIYGGR